MPIDMDLFDIDMDQFEPHLTRLEAAVSEIFKVRIAYMSGLTSISDFKTTVRESSPPTKQALRAKRALKRSLRRRYRRQIADLSARLGVPVSLRNNGIVPLLRAMSNTP